MALPKLSTPIYTITIPSTKKVIKFKQFTVAEQKSLLMAQQSEDQLVMVDTLKDVIRSCVIDNIDVDSLAIFDLEFILLQIRAKSVGEISELLITCPTCEHQTKVTFDLTKLRVMTPEGHTNKIPLSDDVGIVMKYPSVDIIKSIESLDREDVEMLFDIILQCIDYIYDGSVIHYAKEQSEEELGAFVNSLNTTQFKLIQSFFSTMPKLEQKIDFTCPKCDNHHEQVLRGINNFF